MSDDFFPMSDDDEQIAALIEPHQETFSQDQPIYTPKCSSTRSSTLFPRPLDESDMGMIRLELPSCPGHVRPDQLSCACSDQQCKLKQYFHSSRKINKITYNQLTHRQDLYHSLHEKSSQLREARTALIRNAGGDEAAEEVYLKCADLCMQSPNYLKQTDSTNTILAQLCFRVPREQANFLPGKDNEGKGQETVKKRKLLAAQINAFIRLFIESGNSDYLFLRNGEGYNAMEMAGLTNKSEALVYLATLYNTFGKDPNETNKNGHTILHIMARKGDEIADSLEKILNLRDVEGKRLLHWDVINVGRKTPLDVAMACAEMFSTGENRTVYKRVIDIFHRVIHEEAEEMFGEQEMMTFQNF